MKPDERAAEMERRVGWLWDQAVIAAGPERRRLVAELVDTILADAEAADALLAKSGEQQQ